MCKLVTDETSHVLGSAQHTDDRRWKSKNGMKAQRSQVQVIFAGEPVKLPILRYIIGEFLLRDTEK